MEEPHRGEISIARCESAGLTATKTSQILACVFVSQPQGENEKTMTKSESKKQKHDPYYPKAGFRAYAR